MSVARVTELSATSDTSFEDAIKEAVARATKTLRGVEGAWVKDQNILIENGNITGYKVNVEVTFLLEESDPHQLGRAGALRGPGLYTAPGRAGASTFVRPSLPWVGRRPLQTYRPTRRRP